MHIAGRQACPYHAAWRKSSWCAIAALYWAAAVMLAANDCTPKRARRPEMKFSGLDQLIARIQGDIGLASAALETPGHARMMDDPFMTL